MPATPMSSRTSSSERASSGHVRWLVAALAAWLIAAIALGASGVAASSPVPLPAIAILLAAGVLLLYWLAPAVRRALDAVPSSAMVGFHLVRIVAGANFLRLSRSGELPTSFADVAGWGDIAVGIGAALVLAFCLPARSDGRRRALLAWNALGLADILLVLGNGARLFLQDPALVAPFAGLPLAVLPLFVVPVVIASHVVLFARYWRGASATG